MYATVWGLPNPEILGLSVIGLASTKESTEATTMQFSTLERQVPVKSGRGTNTPTHPSKH
jgi:hypothetical protein